MSLYHAKQWVAANVPGMGRLQAILYRFKPYNRKFRTYYVRRSWGKGIESASGEGSSLAVTEALRRALPGLWESYGIQSVLDIPCGDFHWMKEVSLNDIQYIGADIVGELIDDNRSRYSGPTVEFRQLDMLKDALPTVDLILCRDCFLHYPYRFVSTAIEHFVASGSRYLLATTYPAVRENEDLPTPGLARNLNLTIAPFLFPKPLAEIDEENDGKTMALWDLRDLSSENSGESLLR
jgi:hypothetical protein